MESGPNNLKRHDDILTSDVLHCPESGSDTNVRFSASLHLLHAHRPEPRRPACARDRARLQNRPIPIRSNSTGVDEEVRHLMIARTEHGWREIRDDS